MDKEMPPLCGQCAKRLGKDSEPWVPALLDGRCPQCGGSESLDEGKAESRYDSRIDPRHIYVA